MIFDGHSDIWTDVTNKMMNKGETDILRKGHLEKCKSGDISGGIFVMWIDPPHDVDPKKRIKEIETCMLKEIESVKDIIQIVRTYDDIEKAKKENKGMIVIGMEGISHIGSDVELIENFYNMGARHASLTWNETNELATGMSGDENRGLTDVGRAAVRKLESLNMIVDVSHLNEKSFWDLMETAKGPVIASHSNSRTLCDHRRNLTDDQIKAITKSGGLIGMNSFRELVAVDRENQNVEYLVDHIDYIRDLVGIEYVAFGFDFCDFIEGDTLGSFGDPNMEPGADGINSADEARNIIKELVKRGYTQEDIDKISYENYFKFFKKVLK